jgi:hypothetical protein
MKKSMITDTIERQCLGVVAGALMALLVAGCAVQSTKTHAFSRIDRIESNLQRGITTKGDVLLLLGEPNGAGALGGFDALRGPDAAGKGPIIAWYYQSIKASIVGGIKQQLDILLVFFEGDVVDGFLWFSDKGEGEGKWN